MPSSSKTGHEGFDFWMDEYSSCIQELEDSLHVRSTTPSITKSKRQHEATLEFLGRAGKVLTSLVEEARTVPENDPALRRELADICGACEMQLRTYDDLCRQTDLFQRPTPAPGRTSKTAAAKRPPPSSASESALRSALFATSSRPSSPDAVLKGSATGSSSNQRGGVQAKTRGRVQKQNADIRAALESLRETEEVAMGITGELHSQRETLQGTRGHLSQVSSMTHHAKGLLKSMNTPWWQKW